MKSRDLPTSNAIIISTIVLVALLVFSTVLFSVVQKSSTRQDKETNQQQDLALQLLSIKVGISELTLPAYSYLIKLNEEQEKAFRTQSRVVRREFLSLKAKDYFEEIDYRLIQESLDKFDELTRIENEIFDLKGEDISKYGPTLIEDMRVYENSIDNKLQRLSVLEEVEFATFLRSERATSRQSVILISLAAAIMGGGALVAIYLGRKI